MIVPPIEIFLYVVWNTQKQQIQISPAARISMISTTWNKAHNGWNLFYLLHGSTQLRFI
jgi:hypothetical protein